MGDIDNGTASRAGRNQLDGSAQGKLVTRFQSIDTASKRWSGDFIVHVEMTADLLYTYQN